MRPMILNSVIVANTHMTVKKVFTIPLGVSISATFPAQEDS